MLVDLERTCIKFYNMPLLTFHALIYPSSDINDNYVLNQYDAMRLNFFRFFIMLDLQRKNILLNYINT